MPKTNIAVLGTQWGDEGKGKIVDMLTPFFAAVARYQGGSKGRELSINLRFRARTVGRPQPGRKPVAAFSQP